MDNMTENGTAKRIRIEVDPDGPEEVIIRCRKLTPDILKLQELLETGGGKSAVQKLSLNLGEEEHLVELRRILFFESADGRVSAHTDKRIYRTDMKLYELEDILPKSFMRVSKMCILNLEAVSWLKRELTGPCRVGFGTSPKQVYISRMYYKPFREKLEEMRMILK
ncbi:MAG: LytTR family transcriptional regulator DNA-binding domain-containing protein [Clostridia bacterium]|nr:LytTR family transcriptional regulator DNA-binding domain-containing protein [Clostridia bacterium]